MRAESTLFAVYVFGFRVPLKSTCARKPPYKHFKLDFVNLHHDILLFFAKHTVFGFRFSVFGFQNKAKQKGRERKNKRIKGRTIFPKMCFFLTPGVTFLGKVTPVMVYCA